MKRSLCRVVRILIVIAIGCAFISIPGKVKAETVQKLYTAYNIWFEKPEKISSINYKRGAIIPVGTHVRDVEIITHRKRTAITFTTVKENRAFLIYWKQKLHPGKTVQHFKNNLFTTMQFEELSAGMTNKEIMAIKKGEPVKGMSKKALIACYGPPPEHGTFRQEHNVWIYWTSKFVRKKIFFGNDDRITDFKKGL